MKTCAVCLDRIEEGEEIPVADDSQDVVCSDKCLEEYFS